MHFLMPEEMSNHWFFLRSLYKILSNLCHRIILYRERNKIEHFKRIVYLINRRLMLLYTFGTEL